MNIPWAGWLMLAILLVLALRVLWSICKERIAEKRRWQSWDSFSEAEAGQICEGMRQALCAMVHKYAPDSLNDKLCPVGGAYELLLWDLNLYLTIKPRLPVGCVDVADVDWSQVTVQVAGNDLHHQVSNWLDARWDSAAAVLSLKELVRPCDVAAVDADWLFQHLFTTECAMLGAGAMHGGLGQL